MTQGTDGGSFFTFDDDEDMEAILDAAAKAGSAATDEQHSETSFEDELFGIQKDAPEEPTYAPVAEAPVQQVTPEPEPEAAEEPEWDLEPTEPLKPRDLEAELTAMREESESVLNGDTWIEPVAEEPVAPVVTPVATPKAEPVVEPPVETSTPAASVTSTAQREPVHSRMVPVVRQTEEEQIAYAKKIIEVADKYRELNANTRNVVAQLISPEAEVTEDAATVAIRAINADELTFSVMEALKSAKAQEPVDRAFYILSLQEEIRVSLGQLVTAFTGEEITVGDTLGFSKALVVAIEKLDAEAVKFVTATENVLRVAKQS